MKYSKFIQAFKIKFVHNVDKLTLETILIALLEILKKSFKQSEKVGKYF